LTRRGRAALAAWALWPYWYLLKRVNRRTWTSLGTIVAGITAALVVGVGANSFLATSSFVGGRPNPTADGVTILFVPVVQWCVIGVSNILLGFLASGERTERLAKQSLPPTTGGKIEVR